MLGAPTAAASACWLPAGSWREAGTRHPLARPYARASGPQSHAPLFCPLLPSHSRPKSHHPPPLLSVLSPCFLADHLQAALPAVWPAKVALPPAAQAAAGERAVCGLLRRRPLCLCIPPRLPACLPQVSLGILAKPMLNLHSNPTLGHQSLWLQEERRKSGGGGRREYSSASDSETEVRVKLVPGKPSAILGHGPAGVSVLLEGAHPTQRGSTAFTGVVQVAGAPLQTPCACPALQPCLLLPAPACEQEEDAGGTPSEVDHADAAAAARHGERRRAEAAREAAAGQRTHQGVLGPLAAWTRIAQAAGMGGQEHRRQFCCAGQRCAVRPLLECACWLHAVARCCLAADPLLCLAFLVQPRAAPSASERSSSLPTAVQQQPQQLQQPAVCLATFRRWARRRSRRSRPSRRRPAAGPCSRRSKLSSSRS